MLGVVAPGQEIEQEAELPCGALGGSFSASEPRASEHVKALADGREEAEVVTFGFDFAEEGAALRSAQHVEESVLGQV